MVRIALVSPYSWTYPGGVTRHIEALANRFIEEGHHVRVFAPHDPPDRLAARLHKGAWPQERALPDYLVPLGRTIGFPANGAVSNIAYTPSSVAALRRELAAGDFDVAHVHEPVAPTIGWDVLMSSRVPLVGTFHCYSDNRVSNNIANLLGVRRRLNRLHVRIAVSEAAAWTGRRFFGGHYRVIPNGVDVPPEPPVADGQADPLEIVFVGQAVERKGLPVLLRAFEALRDVVPTRLTLVGAGPSEIENLVMDDRGIEALGKVDDETKEAVLARAHVLAAPSLGGESFGMVLTEAFAAGTPVVASDIAGYGDVVRDGVDGVLFPRGDATALAETLRDLAVDHERRVQMAHAAAEHAPRYAWPHVAAEVMDAYKDAIAAAAAEPQSGFDRFAVKTGLRPADGRPRAKADRHLPSLEPPVSDSQSRARKIARRAGLGAASVLGLGLSWFALQRIGIDRIGESLLKATPWWVLLGLALMCLSMAVRGLAWYQILRAALPGVRVRRSDALQGTFIGVLMSATLPARLGEPSRALIVARRLGRPRDRLPVVLGSIVSQAMLNIVALVILGIVMFSSVNYFSGHHGALLAFTITPVAILAGVLIAPTLLRSGVPSRSRRVQAFVRQARNAMAQVRAGLRVFRDPRRGAQATILQLTAWGIQWLSCYVLLVALGLDGQAGMGAAAAVLFAVNVTAVLPATPSNLGVFQAACVAVLTGAYHVSSADALGYGIILQAVEIATAVIMGAPALLKEGLSWRDVRLRALHTAPVQLSPVQRPSRDGVEVEA
jgi:phosphatidyl-myo-inositol alpha-mannosyltransferase